MSDLELDQVEASVSDGCLTKMLPGTHTNPVPYQVYQERLASEVEASCLGESSGQSFPVWE